MARFSLGEQHELFPVEIVGQMTSAGWIVDVAHVEKTLQPGSVLSRYGRPSGSFVLPEGTPFSAKGSPPSCESFGESFYRLTQTLKVNSGIAAYWQGGGLGIQYELPGSIQSLGDAGVLKGYSP